MPAYSPNDSSGQIDVDAPLGLYGTYVRRMFAVGRASLGVITAPAFADIWTDGGQAPFPVAPVSLEVVSLNSADTAAGTGARSIMVAGLDANFNEISTTVALNGGVVAMSGAWRRVNLIIVSGAGSNGTNLGRINIRDAGGGTIRSAIPAGRGISQQSFYTVPAGHTLLVRQATLKIIASAGGVGAGKGADAELYFGAPADLNPFYRLPLPLSCTDLQPSTDSSAIPVPEKMDFMLRCTYTSAALTL